MPDPKYQLPRTGATVDDAIGLALTANQLKFGYLYNGVFYTTSAHSIIIEAKTSNTYIDITEPTLFKTYSYNGSAYVLSGGGGGGIIQGYLYNGAFYEESTHTTLITPDTKFLYIDITNNTSYIPYSYSGSDYIQCASVIHVDNVTIEKNSNNQINIKDAGVSKTKLNSNVADNSTIELNSGNGLQIKDLGITNAKLATDIKVGSLASLNTTNKSNIVNALNELKNAIDTQASKSFTFKGFITDTEPTGTIEEGSLWYENTTLPTTFPINVKTYTNNAWSSTTSEYTPSNLDLWSLVSISKGYYYFGNGWNIIDQDILTDNTSINFNNSNQLEVKNGGISNDKLNNDIKIGSLSDLTTTEKSNAVGAINELNSNKIDKPGAGLKKNGTTLSHSNSVIAQNTSKIGKIKFDSEGHIKEFTEVSIYQHYYKIVYGNGVAYPNAYGIFSIITQNSNQLDYAGIKSFLQSNGYTSLNNIYPVNGIQTTKSAYVASTSGGTPTVSVAISSVLVGMYLDTTNDIIRLQYNYGSNVNCGDGETATSSSNTINIFYTNSIKIL